MDCGSPAYVFQLGAVILLLLSVLAIREVFKPVDRRWTISGRKWRLPPSPPGQLVVGNLLQFLKARRTGRLAKYLTSLNVYGEMTTLHMGSKTWVLLNSNRVVSEIIAKRGRITNERPYMPIASGLVSNDKRTVIRQTREWTEGRRVMHQLLSGSNLKVYGQMQEIESNALLMAYLKYPKYWYAHHFRYATSVLYRVVMGYPLEKSKAELDDYQRVNVEFVSSISASFVDFFPMLSKLPKFLQPWRKYWVDMGRFHLQVFRSWWDPVKAAVDAGSAPPSFVRDVLLHPETKYTGDNEDALYLATSVMSAGGDNTRMTMNTFTMALISHPHIFDRARAEIDKICGFGNRLPTLTDMENMPYITALIKEVLRWRPTVPVVPPHTLTEDLEFEGYHFPAGTDFLINSMAVSVNFDKANEFIPERWMDGTESNPVANFWGFGGGRRVCVGYKVAHQALFLAFTKIIYCFDIQPDGPFDSRVLNHTLVGDPFPVKIMVRGPEYEKLINDCS